MPNGQQHPKCEAYRAQGADVYGFCLYRYVAGVTSLDALSGYCAAAGDWEDRCRHGWVSGRMNPASNVPTETLLEACGDSVDCTFELIDIRVADDVLVQMQRCGKYAGHYAGDCVSHAMQRWYQQKPDREEFDRVVVFDKQFFDKVGHWTGAVVQCQGVGECPDNDRVGKFCRNTVRTFASGRNQCPGMIKDPLPHNKGKLRSQPAGKPQRQPRAKGRQPGKPGPGRPPGTRQGPRKSGAPSAGGGSPG